MEKEWNGERKPVELNMFTESKLLRSLRLPKGFGTDIEIGASTSKSISRDFAGTQSKTEPSIERKKREAINGKRND